MDRFIKNLAKGAGAILRQGFRTHFAVSHKSTTWDLVTEYDIKAEKYVMGRIQQRFPRHGILSEEAGQARQGKQLWIIDPLDGTTAFTRGIAQFSVAIAFIGNNQLEFSVVYDPIADELFFAQRGKGASLNGRKLTVSAKRELDHTWIASHNRYSLENANFGKNFLLQVWKNNLIFMRTGSGELSGAYVAAGRYDILLSKGLNAWDTAAAGLLIKEAGGKVSTIDGKPYRWNSDSLLAANSTLHKKMLQVLKKR